MITTISITIACLLVVLLYARLEAEREAMFYHLLCNRDWCYTRKELPWQHDEHGDFVVQRLMFHLPVYYILFLMLHWWAVLAIVALAMMWLFVHDGYYYAARNKFNPGVYPEGFRSNNHHDPDDVKTHSARWRTRKYSCIIGVVLFTISLVLVII